jgi:integrase
MDAMPRPRPPYLHRFHTRHGKYIWYVRKPGCKRVRIRAQFGTPEFDAAYHRAIDGLNPQPQKQKAVAGTLAWLWDRYREVGAWKGLSAATRRQRENIMAGVLKVSGDKPFAAITTKAIAAGRDRRADTPSQARNYLDCMRGLFKWAAGAGHVARNPALEVENPPKAGGEGFPMWSEDEIDQYLTFWPIGTRQRVWIDVLLYTGLRRGDAVKLGNHHIRNGVASIRTEKSGGDVAVTIPILPVLEATLKAGPCGERTFICGENGKSLTKESFGNMFRKACRLAKVPKSAHRLRKAGATRAAENGATVAELEAIFGWRGGGMAALYTRAADRARLAKGAMTKLERAPSENPMCPPDQKVGTPEQITEK